MVGLAFVFLYFASPEYELTQQLRAVPSLTVEYTVGDGAKLNRHVVLDRPGFVMATARVTCICQIASSGRPPSRVRFGDSTWFWLWAADDPCDLTSEDGFSPGIGFNLEPKFVRKRNLVRVQDPPKP
jgi:hypothetical protein